MKLRLHDDGQALYIFDTIEYTWNVVWPGLCIFLIYNNLVDDSYYFFYLYGIFFFFPDESEPSLIWQWPVTGHTPARSEFLGSSGNKQPV